MMELGATLCLPRAPLCLGCPVYEFCLTRGEHITPKRAPLRSHPAAYLLHLRKRGTATEVLLAQRAADASLMPGMFELPPIPMEAVTDREPVLRLRHAITNTNYYVQVYADRGSNPDELLEISEGTSLRGALTIAPGDLHWIRTSRLSGLPLTGLARKVLQRLHIMQAPQIDLLQE
jgi:A/G-specific adenine glycosylase